MIATLLMGAAAGAALGMVYFTLLWQATRALAATGRFGIFALGAFARLAAMLGMLALFFHLSGGLPVLAAATLGFVSARIAATRIAARAGTRGKPCR